MGREGRDYWEAQLSEYWDSGLTIQEYSELKELPYESTRRWIRVLQKARQDDVSAPESLELVEIKPLQTNASDNSGIRLLIDGIEIAGTRLKRKLSIANIFSALSRFKILIVLCGKWIFSCLNFDMAFHWYGCNVKQFFHFSLRRCPKEYPRSFSCGREIFGFDPSFAFLRMSLACPVPQLLPYSIREVSTCIPMGFMSIVVYPTLSYSKLKKNDNIVTQGVIKLIGNSR